MPTLCKVEDNELQAVNKWLESHLPESWALFCLTRSILNGSWAGQSFYTLGWPSIRGVVAPATLKPDHPCPDFYTNVNMSFIYVPKDEDVNILLSSPEVVDWSKPFMFHIIPERIYRSLVSTAQSRGFGSEWDCSSVKTFHAKAGDNIPLRPIPKGFQCRPVNVDTEVNYCVSTWKYRKPHADKYFMALVSRFPSVCMADDQGSCVSFEVGTEYGSIGFLHTREEARGRGLAKAVISHLVEEYQKLNLDVYACVVEGNDVSYSLHESLGFECIKEKFYVVRYVP